MFQKSLQTIGGTVTIISEGLLLRWPMLQAPTVDRARVDLPLLEALCRLSPHLWTWQCGQSSGCSSSPGS